VHIRQVIPRDAIPSVDDPGFGDGYDGDPGDRMVVVDADPPRAYPVRYLDYHEVVNDDLGTVPRAAREAAGKPTGEAEDADPVAVTWCPLCGSAVVYDRTVEGRVLEFGVSGKLADDDLVLYDRQTESEWKQSSGTAIAGPLEGASLSVRPSTVLPWERFRDAHPEAVVLHPPGGASEAAGEGDTPEPIDYDDAPYANYLAGEGFGLAAHRGEGSREWSREDLDPKAVVLGVECGGEAVGFPLPRVRAAGGVVQTTVGGRDIVVVATERAGVHSYTDPGCECDLTDGELVADGATWDPATGEATDGRRLRRLPTRRLFAFAWQDDHGPDAFYTQSE
jgi:hypothetical protein